MIMRHTNNAQQLKRQKETHKAAEEKRYGSKKKELNRLEKTLEKKEDGSLKTK
jgi:hypothetical protein